MKKTLLLLFLAILSIFLFGQVHPVYAQIDTYEETIPVEQAWSLDINEIDHFTNIVIFIRFQDEAGYVAPNPFSFYENLFNGVDTVSLRDYFLEVSYGQMDISTTFATPSDEIFYYVDSHNRSYFQEYDAITNPDGYTESNRTAREHELLKNATDFVDTSQLVDDSVDLDVNDDGRIDSISYVVSGEAGEWNSILWPHKWSLSTYYDYTHSTFKVNAPTINGVNAYTYTFELLGNTPDYQYAVSVGVLAHETFHLISSPDLYHYYDYDWIDPIGYWGLMESIHAVPNHMLGYMKEAYGNWIPNVTEITESGSYTLYPLQDSPNNLYKINTGYSNEYVYLEYRDNVGLYESGLPSSGLLAYRVDLDYVDEGNVSGYYDDYGDPRDEVFIFRPGIIDTIPPITFDGIDNESIDEDGNISQAALSNRNPYDEMGNNTDILMFYSDGSLMDMKIYNVVERQGHITFDVYLPPKITLDCDYDINPLSSLYLVDAPGLSYQVNVTNIAPSTTLYYTLDGSTPNNTSIPYTGVPIEITAENNDVQLALYDGLELLGIVSKSFQFTSSIESAHYPYGDEVSTSWYVDLSSAQDVDLIFNQSFSLEVDYDYLYVHDGEFIQAYTGTELRSQTLSFHTDGILIEFESDEYLSDYYGFKAEVEVSPTYTFTLNGEQTVTLNVFEPYTELGYVLEAEAGFYEVTSSEVNTSVLGTYVIYYRLYDSSDTLIKTLSRTIHVVDTSLPVIVLNGEATIYVELGADYTELGATYTDNVDISGNAIVGGDIVDGMNIGIYTVTYNVSDASGNIAFEVTRTVIVRDTVAPLVTLNPSIDSLQIGDNYAEQTVTIIDLQSTLLTITGVVDTSTAGTYILTYLVEDASGNTSSILRYVTVYQAKSPVEFQLSATLTTIEEGTTYVDGTCTIATNDTTHDCYVISSSVNSNASGMYQITYGYFDGIHEYTYQRFVFVVGENHRLSVFMPIKKEEGESL